MGVMKEQVESTLRSKLSPSHISTKLWTKKHGFGRKDVPRSRSTQIVNLKTRQRLFDFEDLLRASAEVLGKGTFGTAYKAVLEGGMMVAVKRLKDVTVSEPEFREKTEFVGAMDHQNLVPLRAYYYNKEEKLLVYDYMPMGNLSALLHVSVR